MVFNFYPKSIQIIESAAAMGEPMLLHSELVVWPEAEARPAGLAAPSSPRPMHVFEPVARLSPDPDAPVNAWVELGDEPVEPEIPGEAEPEVPGLLPEVASSRFAKK